MVLVKCQEEYEIYMLAKKLRPVFWLLTSLKTLEIILYDFLLTKVSTSGLIYLSSLLVYFFPVNSRLFLRCEQSYKSGLGLFWPPCIYLGVLASGMLHILYNVNVW